MKKQSPASHIPTILIAISAVLFVFFPKISTGTDPTTPNQALQDSIYKQFLEERFPVVPVPSNVSDLKTQSDAAYAIYQETHYNVEKFRADNDFGPGDINSNGDLTWVSIQVSSQKEIDAYNKLHQLDKQALAVWTEKRLAYKATAAAAGVTPAAQTSQWSPGNSNTNHTSTYTQAKKNCSDIYDPHAECYTSISPIVDPLGTEINAKSSPTFYLQGIYRIGIGICFVLGVIMFTWAGIEYIITESISGKSDAKGRIISALTGLAIALASYILLYTINPDLLNMNSLQEVNVAPVSSLGTK